MLLPYSGQKRQDGESMFLRNHYTTSHGRRFFVSKSVLPQPHFSPINILVIRRIFLFYRPL